MKEKVVLGMSGGVDSSVAALLLQREGYEVYGVFMRAGAGKKFGWLSGISWKEEERTVKEICKKLRIKLRVVNVGKSYENKIIAPMVRDYERGLTPNPDILCNKIGKFVLFWKIAKEIGAGKIATGHYARVRRGKDGYELLMGKDKSKDQSYFLCGLKQKDLSHVLFPLGDLTKEEVRRIARREGFSNWDKRGSRGVCYLGKIDLKKFLKKRIKEKKGKLVSPSGKIIGYHQGSMFFTIGERVREREGFEVDRKIEGWEGKKLFVAEKRKGNVLVVVPEGHDLLKRRRVLLKNFHLINPRGKIVKKGLKGRIRHLGELVGGKLKKEKGNWFFVFNKGVEGIASGQYLVVYYREKVIGCGEIG